MADDSGRVKGRYRQRIDETLIFDIDWGKSHFEMLRQSYSAAPFFDLYEPMLRELYTIEDPLLSRVNRAFIDAFCRELSIDTTISWSTDYDVFGSRTERLVNLCIATGATRYLSGPRARSYLELDRFEECSVSVEFVGSRRLSRIHPTSPAVRSRCIDHRSISAHGSRGATFHEIVYPGGRWRSMKRGR